MGSAVPRRFRVHLARCPCEEAQRPPKDSDPHDGEQENEYPAIEPGGQQMKIKHEVLGGLIEKFSRGSRSLEVTEKIGRSRTRNLNVA